jgi:hypothetical protein
MLRVTWIAAVAAVVAWSVASSIACSARAPSAPPPVPPAPVAVPADAAADAAPLDRDLPQLVERSLAMYRDVARAFAASGEDCGAASARLRELAGRYRDVTAANAAVMHDGRAGELRAALGAHDQEFDAAAQAVMQSPTMARCARDPGFGKAFDELVAPPP